MSTANSRPQPRQAAGLVRIRLEGLAERRLASFASKDKVLADNFAEQIILIIPFAAFAGLQNRKGKLHAVGIESVQFERRAAAIGHFKRNHQPAVGRRNGNRANLGLESARGVTLERNQELPGRK